MSWVIPADPVSAWLLGGDRVLALPVGQTRFCSVRGDPPLTGKKKHPELCDSHEVQVTRLRGSGLGTGASQDWLLSVGAQKATEKCVNC